MIQNRDLGDIRVVSLQYTHVFHSNTAENESDAVKWRVNPKISGPSYVIGDLSTHIYYTSQLLLLHMKVEKLLCDRQSFIKSRAPLEDNASIIMHYDNGAVRTMWVSAINAGSMDSLRIRIVGPRRG